MQRIINNPNMVAENYLEGFVKAHKDLIQATENPRDFKYVETPIKGIVGIVTGGGSGYKPAFIWYLGKDLVDEVAILYGNYAGDNMKVQMAIEDAEDAGIEVRTVVANDDVPSAPLGQKEKRRGVAGEIFMWKAAGAKAANGGTLDEVIATAQKAIDNTRSVGIGLSSCIIPAVGKANFHIEPGKMEFGIGHHGEPGLSAKNIVLPKEMAELALASIIPDLSRKKMKWLCS